MGMDRTQENAISRRVICISITALDMHLNAATEKYPLVQASQRHRAAVIGVVKEPE
jgi:hypothetical protein